MAGLFIQSKRRITGKKHAHTLYCEFSMKFYRQRRERAVAQYRSGRKYNDRLQVNMETKRPLHLRSEWYIGLGAGTVCIGRSTLLIDPASMLRQ